MPPAEELVAPASSLTRERARIAAFAIVSLAIHAGLFFAFWREPDPLASIGEQVISIEIVVGATAPAGVAQTPGENETASPAAPADPEPAEAVREAEQKATVQPQEVPVAEQDATPEQPEPKVEEPPKQVEAAKPEPSPPEPEVAKVEPPKEAEPPPPEPKLVEAAKPELPPPEPKPPVTVMESERPDPKPVAVTPPEPVKPAEVKPVPPPPKPVQQKAAPKPKQRVAARPVQTKSEQPTRTAAPTQERPSERARASAPASPANNIGRGRSDNDTNYRGLVAAHLARFKQYPSDARNSGKTGTAAVTFTVGGSGGVASVSLARSSGIASIDQEVVAMVRRASPFPPPPGGRPQSFTVPVSFRLN
jgi:protein TonB